MQNLFYTSENKTVNILNGLKYNIYLNIYSQWIINLDIYTDLYGSLGTQDPKLNLIKSLIRIRK